MGLRIVPHVPGLVYVEIDGLHVLQGPGEVPLEVGGVPDIRDAGEGMCLIRLGAPPRPSLLQEIRGQQEELFLVSASRFLHGEDQPRVPGDPRQVDDVPVGEEGIVLVRPLPGSEALEKQRQRSLLHPLRQSLPVVPVEFRFHEIVLSSRIVRSRCIPVSYYTMPGGKCKGTRRKRIPPLQSSPFSAIIGIKEPPFKRSPPP